MSKAETVAHWMQNQNMGIIPAQVDIDLTNICNQDCFYCNSIDHRTQRPVQKGYTEYIKLLDKIADWRRHTPKSYGTTHTITYPGGGEPTILNGYEKVLEHTIDLGFLTSITTNGSKLEELINNVPAEKIKKMAWIGIDIDAGVEQKYELIRHSKTKKSLFPKVVENASDLVKLSAKVDLKALINKYNDDEESIEELFAITKDIGARQLYIRPTILNGIAYNFDHLIEPIKKISKKYNVRYKLNLTKTLLRNYKKCHQMFQFPVFCADGEIYVCCDFKGNSEFSLGRWDTGDFRDLWLSKRHYEIYNKIDTTFCPHCRPNKNNIEIQNILNNPEYLEGLYT